jgi:hypothetical protein
MRIEVNVLTGEITEQPSASVTWEVPVVQTPSEPTKAELLAQLQTLQTQINALP